jgi:subtilisin family serine protease
MWKMMKTIEKCSAKWLQRGLIAVIILMFFFTTGVVNVQAQEENPPEHPGESAPAEEGQQPPTQIPEVLPTETPEPTLTPTPTLTFTPTLPITTETSEPVEPTQSDANYVLDQPMGIPTLPVEYTAEPTITPTETPTLEASPTAGDLAPLLIPKGGPIQTGQYIVVYKSSYKVSRHETEIKGRIKEKGGRVKRVFSKSLNGVSVSLDNQALKAMRENPDVAYIEADMVINVDEALLSANAIQTGATWGLDRIDQVSIPLNGTYQYQASGAGVNVYVIDSGILSTHSEFGGRVNLAFDSVGDGQNGTDCQGHGTHVAGIIGGNTYGVAKNVNLFAVRVLNCSGSGTTSSVIAGIDWVTQNHSGPSVANLSLGGSSSTALDTALNNMINSGVIAVVAAGNANNNACSYSPARVPNAITVGSTTSDDVRSSFSNYGSCVDIFAPGSGIKSAIASSDSATASMSGTSMASPHVAGVAALYLEEHPGASVGSVTDAILSNASSGVISDAGSGAPTRLVYSLFATSVIPEDHPTPTETPATPDSTEEPAAEVPTADPTRTPTRTATPLPTVSIPSKVTSLSPSGNIYEIQPFLVWEAIPTATSYHLQLYRSSTRLVNLEVPATVCNGEYCFYQPDSPLTKYTKYKWRVRALVNGVWTKFNAFTVFKLLKPIPTLISPRTTIQDIQPVFVWKNIPVADYYQFEIYDGYVLKYIGTLDQDDCDESQCAYQPEADLVARKYRWRVRAYAYDVWAAYSSFSKFKISK